MILTDASLQIIPDSRGNNTLQTVFICGDKTATASVPAGKSTGSREAAILDPRAAVGKFTSLKGQIAGKEFSSLEEFDNFLISLDGTANKSNLGGNLILSLSIAFAKLLAKSKNLQPFGLIGQVAGLKTEKFPRGFYNLIEGGVHAQNSLPFQEYLLVPEVSSPKESLKLVNDFIKFLGIEVEGRFGSLHQGDEGGFTVPSDDPVEGLLILDKVRELTGQKEDRLSLDVAASALYRQEAYQVGPEKLDREQFMEMLKNYRSQFNLLSIEDPFEENDWEGFETITREIGGNTWIVGDDLTTTNPGQVKIAGEKRAANAMIIKPNQIGTVTETIKAALLAKSLGWKIIVSHRSGETMDDFIADLSVGLQVDGLKAGCPLEKERLVKYQRLIEIEDQL